MQGTYQPAASSWARARAGAASGRMITPGHVRATPVAVRSTMAQRVGAKAPWSLAGGRWGFRVKCAMSTDSPTAGDGFIPGLDPATITVGALGVKLEDPSIAGDREEDPEEPALVVFSGGTAFNSIAARLKELTTRVSHVLPVSDDGGSTAEIVRFLGGPAVGDIRSRCLRLADCRTGEARAVRQLLAHRLHPSDMKAAKDEWLEITEGESPLWDGISEGYKHTIRAFLVHFQVLVMRQNCPGQFCYLNGSVGNFFFAGARTFFGSMDSAVFLFSRVSGIPSESLVLPCICTEERITLGAQLEGGQIIRGQNNISHPGRVEPCGERAAGQACTTVVSKDEEGPPLPAPIRRVFYLDSDGSHEESEVFPSVNPQVIERLEQADEVVYAMGSLYSSICPSLVLQGVGEAIAARDCEKVMILNGSLDRETEGMDAVAMVGTVTRALNRTFAHTRGSFLANPPSSYVTRLIVPEGCEIEVDEAGLEAMGVEVRWLPASAPVALDPVVPGPGDAGGEKDAEKTKKKKKTVLYDPEALVSALGECAGVFHAGGGGGEGARAEGVVGALGVVRVRPPAAGSDVNAA